MRLSDLLDQSAAAHPLLHAAAAHLPAVYLRQLQERQLALVFGAPVQRGEHFCRLMGGWLVCVGGGKYKAISVSRDEGPMVVSSLCLEFGRIVVLLILNQARVLTVMLVVVQLVAHYLDLVKAVVQGLRLLIMLWLALLLMDVLLLVVMLGLDQPRVPGLPLGHLVRFNQRLQEDRLGRLTAVLY